MTWWMWMVAGAILGWFVLLGLACIVGTFLGLYEGWNSVPKGPW